MLRSKDNGGWFRYIVASNNQEIPSSKGLLMGKLKLLLPKLFCNTGLASCLSHKQAFNMASGVQHGLTLLEEVKRALISF